MFDYKHYVPILRWKQAERQALRDLHEHVRGQITPLVQLVPESIALGKRTPNVEGALRKIARDMRECWGTRPLLVDLSRIDRGRLIEGRLHPLAFLARHAAATSVAMVPVTGLDRNPPYQAAVRQVASDHGEGTCLRLFRGDLASPSLQAEVDQLLGRIHAEPGQVDLVVDLECHDASYPGFDSLCSLVPEISKWRSLAVASGAFPPDLTQWSTPGTYRIHRQDWLAWLGEIRLAEKLVRRPAFSDYGIYHPVYMRPQFPNPSASIRYTSHEEWVIMKGEGILNEGGPGPRQWPANAQILCGMPEFCGATFSAGDAYILDKANHPTPTGSARTWLQAGFNHHMTFVVRQVASLFAT